MLLLGNKTEWPVVQGNYQENKMKRGGLLGVVIGLLFFWQLSAAQDTGRFVEQFNFPSTTRVVIVAEGEGEPSSIGSYSVRIYSGIEPEFPVDDFITGIILPRDGVVERVVFQDVNGDAAVEIVVIQRNAGSGSYLAADALQVENNELSRLASVGGLAPESDPVAALKTKILTALATDRSGAL